MLYLFYHSKLLTLLSVLNLFFSEQNVGGFYFFTLTLWRAKEIEQLAGLRISGLRSGVWSPRLCSPPGNNALPLFHPLKDLSWKRAVKENPSNIEAFSSSMRMHKRAEKCFAYEGSPNRRPLKPRSKKPAKVSANRSRNCLHFNI